MHSQLVIANQCAHWCGERWERCLWQIKRPERVAAVNKIEDKRKPEDFVGHRNRGVIGSVLLKVVNSPSHGIRRASPLNEGAKVAADFKKQSVHYQMCHSETSQQTGRGNLERIERPEFATDPVAFQKSQATGYSDK